MRKAFLLISVATLAAFGQDIPRPEYPQPQFQREEWLNLNGRWEFEFDDANAGLREDWAAGAKKFSRAITVPFSFESPKSGIGDTSFHPYVWYRRTFNVPAAWKGKTVLLHFGAVDYLARVWVNGRAAGDHQGGNVPFRFDITPLLKPGANTVVVRAEDQPTDMYMPRGKQYWKPKSAEIFYTRTSGIWQTVWLEGAGASYLEKVRITPSNDGLVRFEARLNAGAPDLEFRAVVREQDLVLSEQISMASRTSVTPGKTVAESASPAVQDRVSAAVAVQRPRFWSPGDPYLYAVTFELRRAGAVIDRVHSYFGFRTVSIEHGKVAVNGRPVYLKFVLDQGYWPESTLTPPSDEAIQYDIRMTKEMGFNGARKHQKVEDPRYLYWADKMGLLVSGEIANAYDYDPTYVARITDEWTQAVERDYNHPSIIVWVPINESWGVPDLRGDSRQRAHLQSLYALTRSLDATRLVIDNEGWEHTDFTDLFALHDYAPNGKLLAETFKDFGKPGTEPTEGYRPPLVPGAHYNGSPLYLSEFGGIAFIPPGANVPKGSWGYSGVEKTEADALARLRSLYEGIAAAPAIIGVCYTQLTDVEQEINGLMTYDRKPKFDPKRLSEINALLR